MGFIADTKEDDLREYMYMKLENVYSQTIIALSTLLQAHKDKDDKTFGINMLIVSENVSAMYKFMKAVEK